MIMVGIRVRVRFGRGQLSAMVVFFGRGQIRSGANVRWGQMSYIYS